MMGRWIEAGGNEFAFQAKDGSIHARVFHRDRDDGRPWCAWTCHTEGNDSFATVEEAKRCALTRLERLLAATEPLR